ncbi:MAG TPA: NAD(P)-dependent oxidoreductase [Candidatus Saccharimonadales bacterium]
MKIVVTNNQSFTDQQKSRLESLGDVTYCDSLPETAKEYLQRIEGADIICSGTAGLQDAYTQVKDVYITVGFVSVAFVDLDVLRKNNVTLSNAPGVNRHAVSEWVMYMVLSLMREFPRFVNTNEAFRKDGNLPPLTIGLAGNKMTILGQGKIGQQVGKLAKAFDMEVSYFKRGDNIITAVSDADVVVNALSSNPSTRKILDKGFFSAMKKGSYFVDVTRSEIVDDEAMLHVLDEGRLYGVASDCGGILVGDTNDPLYTKLLKHPKVLVTPHVSYNTPMSMKLGADVMIDNVEAWTKGKPQNVVT